MIGTHSQTFDTYKYVKELSKLGLPEEQAGFIINTILESKEYDFSKLATREQLSVIERELELIRQEMAKFATREQLIAIERELELIRQEMAKFATREQFTALEREMAKFATKEQLVHLEEKLTNKIDTLEEKLTSKIEAAVATSQSNILKWIIPLFLSNVAMIVGMVITIIKVLGH